MAMASASMVFQPSDEALMAFLRAKLAGEGSEEQSDWLPEFETLIPVVDLYEGPKAYPWRVLAAQRHPSLGGTTEFYCLTPRRQRYERDPRPDRTVGRGTWSANRSKRSVYDKNGVLLGDIKNLTFKILRPPPGGGSLDKINTHWVMDEYKLEAPLESFQKMVLCKVHNLNKEQKIRKRVWSQPWWEQDGGWMDDVSTCRSGGGSKRKRRAETAEYSSSQEVVMPAAASVGDDEDDLFLFAKQLEGELSGCSEQGVAESQCPPAFLVPILAPPPPPPPAEERMLDDVSLFLDQLIVTPDDYCCWDDEICVPGISEEHSGKPR